MQTSSIIKIKTKNFQNTLFEISQNKTLIQNNKIVGQDFNSEIKKLRENYSFMEVIL